MQDQYREIFFYIVLRHARAYKINNINHHAEDVFTDVSCINRPLQILAANRIY